MPSRAGTTFFLSRWLSCQVGGRSQPPLHRRSPLQRAPWFLGMLCISMSLSQLSVLKNTEHGVDLMQLRLKTWNCGMHTDVIW